VRAVRFVQARMVTEDVEGAASFFASVLGIDTFVNEFYVEVPAGAVTLGFSKTRFTEYGAASAPQVIHDVDSDFARLDALNVHWVVYPTTQPWGNRSMTFRGPDGVLVNVFSRSKGLRDDR
jgi:catechol 2,3-dioxygenase-like lactoylglutathione lyase family enzyme